MSGVGSENRLSMCLPSRLVAWWEIVLWCKPAKVWASRVADLARLRGWSLLAWAVKADRGAGRQAIGIVTRRRSRLRAGSSPERDKTLRFLAEAAAGGYVYAAGRYLSLWAKGSANGRYHRAIITEHPGPAGRRRVVRS
jgi:hypothetical protein